MKSKSKKESLVCSESAQLPTDTGDWRVIACYEKSKPGDGATHIALVKGEVAGKENVLVRVQSECMTSEVFGSKKCDCDLQLKMAMKRIEKKGQGVVVYLRHEGRGIGIFNKIRAYHLQDHGLNTVEANEKLGLPVDARDFSPAVLVLDYLGVRSVELLTNNLDKQKKLEKSGLKIAKRRSLKVKSTRFNKEYLKTKKELLGHDL